MSEVIDRFGGDEKTELPRRTDKKSNAKKQKNNNNNFSHAVFTNGRGYT